MVVFEPAILCLIPASRCRDGNVTERVEVVLRMGLSTGVMGRNTRSENQVGGDALATLPNTHVRHGLGKSLDMIVVPTCRSTTLVGFAGGSEVMTQDAGHRTQDAGGRVAFETRHGH